MSIVVLALLFRNVALQSAAAAAAVAVGAVMMGNDQGLSIYNASYTLDGDVDFQHSSNVKGVASSLALGCDKALCVNVASINVTAAYGEVIAVAHSVAKVIGRFTLPSCSNCGSVQVTLLDSNEFLVGVSDLGASVQSAGTFSVSIVNETFYSLDVDNNGRVKVTKLFSETFSTPAWPDSGAGADIFAVPQLFQFAFLGNREPYLLVPDSGASAPYNADNYRWVYVRSPTNPGGSVTLPAGIGGMQHAGL
jgi:hypothetical protein